MTSQLLEQNIQSESIKKQRPRLHKMRVKNFRCIGDEAVEIELDDIVVLVGPNNAGKSSILRAYQAVMSDGSKDGKLSLEDFPQGTIDQNNLPEIEIETVIYDKQAPGEKWVLENEHGEMYVREKWYWNAVDAKPVKVGWDKTINGWASSGGPWGAANVAKAYRPVPHRIEAFDSPEKQAEEVIKLLKQVLDNKIETLKQENEEYKTLLTQINNVQNEILENANEEISAIENKITNTIKHVFPEHVVKFDANIDDLEGCLSFFSASPSLKMGINGSSSGRHLSPINKQGSGARRTLLWAALKLLAEEKNKQKNSLTTKPNVLLLDEPELCLHPSAVREACKVLYELPSSNEWQVMVTTHSPVFIDFSQNHMTIVRVERKDGGAVSGTTIFRPSQINFDEDEKTALKLLNICDPHVAEFFFGGRNIIVEGDTEYTAFKYLTSIYPMEYSNVHIIRARGKGVIPSLIKILNQFGAPYSVLHDTDKQFNSKGEKNAMWSVNQTILKAIKGSAIADKIRLVASIENFEKAFLNKEISSDKPYNTLLSLKENSEFLQKCKLLLDGLLDHSQPLPDGVIEWNKIEQLEELTL